MFESVELMRMAQAMASHAGQRQAVIAENVANADTPGYRARDVAAFKNIYSEPVLSLRTSRESHLDGADRNVVPEIDAAARQKPNGNTVSIESQMLKAGSVRHDHDLALAIYKSSLDILRTAVGRR